MCSKWFRLIDLLFSSYSKVPLAQEECIPPADGIVAR
jgi:hypothetical protein